MFKITLLLLLTIQPIVTDSKETYLILNMENKTELPRNFRTTYDEFPENMENPPSTLGFAELNVSGSGQFSAKSLETLIQSIPNGNITIVDLREEPHAMLNGMAITWYSKNNWTNEGLTPDEIDTDLQNRIQQLKNNPPTEIFKNKSAQETIPISDVETVETEQETVETLGVRYLHLFARDHTRPSDESVDAFIEFVKTMDSDSWLHFHCSAGRGRTTTFMTLYDIIRNGDKASLEEIVKRQELIGGLGLFDEKEQEWKQEHAEIRAELVRGFYQYRLENPNFSISWSEWLANQNSTAD